MKQRYKKYTSVLAACAVLLAGSGGMFPAETAAAAKLIAFPGAVGAGKYATGGRGGEVYHVTNLNDSGEGSFRDAVSKSGRIVVFDVSGTIELEGNILCQSNVTVAGQTAPGGAGITLKNYKMGMSGDNIICRFISSRPGPYAATSSGNDAWGGAKGSNSIIDHCSMGWTTDEQWGLYSNNEYYTVQYSVLGPADSWGGHKKGLHGFGIMLGNGWLTFDHNLIIHNVSRNFRGKVPQQKTADFTNNIIYDWGYQTAYGTIGHLNYVNNTLKAGNSTTGGYHWMYVDSTTSPQNFKVFCQGNRMFNKDGSVNGITNDNWAGVTVKDGIGISKNDLYSNTPFETVVNGENLSTAATCESAAAAYDHVISFAGNGISPDKRTAIDRQCAADAKNGTGQCSGTAAFDSSEANLSKYNIKCGVTYQYPAAVNTPEITDKDRDGMDDDWELARGLDPNDPEDYRGDYCGQGYMNIEYYINDLTVNAFPEGVVTLSPTDVEQTKAISAFETLEAESADIQKTAGASTDGKWLACNDGDYIMFKKVDFGSGAKSLTAVLEGTQTKIELYLDALSGTPDASVQFEGAANLKQVSWTIPTLSGQHSLYIKFSGGSVKADNFVFGKEALPVNGRLFRNLLVADNAYPNGWMLSDGAITGVMIYGDREFTFASLPESLNGAEQIMTACDAKNVFTDYAEFTAAQDITVSILLDTRVEDAGKTPAWLGEYTRTNLTAASSNEVRFAVYEKRFRAGETVTLGSNNMNGNCMNYTVLLREEVAAETTVSTTETTAAFSETTTTETTVTTPETTVSSETETTVTEAVKPHFGDVNCSGAVDVSDAVLLARFIAEDAGAEISTAGKTNADCNGDGEITGQDTIRILQFIAKLIDTLG
ncbi:MAG: carbohydrate-binding protein [Oscillospiraceae bacterium]|nr:carbohydrate-binding protein [Oscillospiraceae bacterium]